MNMATAPVTAASMPTGTWIARMDRNTGESDGISKPPISTVLYRSRRGSARVPSNNGGFPSTHQRAGELAICSLCNLLQVGIACENRLRISRGVDSGRLDFDVFKTGATKLQSEVGLLEGPGDTSGPQLDPPLDLGRHRFEHHDVRNGETPARLQ